jgi:predicted component of type VI protein secretion system
VSRIAAIAALVVFAAVLAACDTAEPASVAKQWPREMRELQIDPVFPPRKDDTPQPISLWLASLDIDDAKQG